MPTLLDGSVISSYFGVADTGMPTHSSAFGDFALRQGEVREVIYPTDPRSRSKTVVEYDVAVAYREGSGPATTTNYPNCQVANLFGGLADKLRYTYRVQTKEPVKGTTISDGSKVILLCVNGERRRAYIVGGINESKLQELKEDGHNLYFDFNGISAKIDKSGQFKLEMRGPTKVDGSIDTDAGASADNVATIDLLKNGNLQFYTKDQKQSLLLDNENKKGVFAFGDWETKSTGTTTLAASKTFKIQSDQHLEIKSSGVMTGDATDSTLLGSTFRQDQQTMHTKLISALGVAAAQLLAASIAIQTAAGSLAVPITGGPLAAPQLVVAGTSVLQASLKLQEAVSAVTSFEASAVGHLSKKNKSD